MYLSEEKRAAIRACFKSQHSNSKSNPEKIIQIQIKDFLIQREVVKFRRFYLRPEMGRKFLRRFKRVEFILI